MMRTTTFTTIAAIIIVVIFSSTRCAGASPTCVQSDGKRYYKTMGGYVDCSTETCPPFQRGSHKNCYCCNGPDEDPVDGKWAEWNMWSACPSSRNNAIRYRIRTCSNPAPLRNGSLCLSTNGRNRSAWEYQQVPYALPASSGFYLEEGILVFCAVVFALIVLVIVIMSMYISHLRRDLNLKSKMSTQSQNEIKHHNITVAIPGNCNQMVEDKYLVIHNTSSLNTNE